MTAMLETKNLGISFGGLKAVDGLSLQINKGQLYGLIGPNGDRKRRKNASSLLSASAWERPTA